jgi:hypothetical protein
MLLPGNPYLDVFMKNKKEIVINPVRLVTAGFVLVPRIPTFFVQQPIGLTADAAARVGVEAFLSVDAKAGKNAWISKVCEASTLTGCKLAKQVYVAMLWPSIAANHTASSSNSFSIASSSVFVA